MTRTLTLLAALMLSSSAAAHPTHDEGAYYPPAPPKPRVVVPETFAEVVADLQKRLDDADVAAEGKRIADLYKACDALEALTAALPEEAKSGSKVTAKATEKAQPRLEASLSDVRIQAAKGAFDEVRASIVSLRTELQALSPTPAKQ